jgi:hypothetical protein
MKKLYNFRLDPTLIKELDKLNGTRTYHVSTALQSYLQSDTQNIYNVNLVDLLNNQIQDLKEDKRYLQNQVNGLMVSRFPLLSRIKLKLLEK